MARNQVTARRARRRRDAREVVRRLQREVDEEEFAELETLQSDSSSDVETLDMPQEAVQGSSRECPDLWLIVSVPRLLPVSRTNSRLFPCTAV
jgi:hypothetical protein